MKKVAIFGAGGISHAHAGAIESRKDLFQLSAVCEANLEAGRKFVDRYNPEAKVYTDYRDLLEAGECDIGIVSLPHFLHFPVGMACLEAKLPVMMEKPLVNTLDELRAIREESYRQQVPVMAGQTRRFSQASYWVKEWMQEGHFGRLESFDIASYSNIQSYLGGASDHWILDGNKAGGGVLMSMAIHRIDWVRALSGEDFTRVNAVGKFDIGSLRNGAEGVCTGWMETTGGAIGGLHATMTLQKSPGFETVNLFGSQGSIREDADGLRCASGRGQQLESWNSQFEGWLDVEKEIAPSYKHSSDGFLNQLMAFSDGIDHGSPLPCSIDDNFNTLATVFALYESMKSGKTVEVPVS